MKVNAVQVIVNKSVELDTITVPQLRRIYSMRQTVWPNNTSIKVFILPKKHSTHQAFSKNMLKLFPYQLEKVWDKLTYSGVGNRPSIVETEMELIQVIQNTPNSIGYVADISPLQGINVLNVVGRKK